jgi:hypothetical protein
MDQMDVRSAEVVVCSFKTNIIVAITIVDGSPQSKQATITHT